MKHICMCVFMYVHVHVQTCVSRFAQTFVLINSILTGPVLAGITGTVIVVNLTVLSYNKDK